jgi:hypothetical protein
MSGFSPYALTHVGIAKELSWGTAVLPAYFIPFTDVKPLDTITYVADAGMRGALAKTYNEMPGTVQSTVEIDGSTFPDSIGLMLLSLLGQDTVVGSAAPYTHSFQLARTAQPPSITVSHFDGVSERQYAGSVCEEMDFTWAQDAALAYTYKVDGIPSVVIAPVTPTPTATTPFMTWAFSATIGGSPKLNVIGFDVDIKRDKVYVQHAANNTQSPTAIVVTTLSFTGKITFDKMDDSELIAYLTNTQPVVILTGVQGTNSITFQMSKCAFTADTVTGKDVMQGEIVYEGCDNASDMGPGMVTLTNAVATY